MVSHKGITDMEYLTSRFWPAREIERYMGWTINWNDGITWRVNCVYPLGPINDIQLEDAIEYVIEFYNSRKTPPAFKITEASEPSDIDEVLADMGFEKHMMTHVQTIDTNDLSCQYPKVPVDILKANNDSISLLMRDSGEEADAVEVRKGIIHRIEGEKGIARVMIDGRIAGVGLGVVQTSWLGLFSIRTIPEYQHKGVGRSMSCALGMWGEDFGATAAFLQVESKNTPAMSLYESIGFKTMYSYWYRILPKQK